MREELLDRLERLAWQFERMHLEEYLNYMNSPRRLFWINFFAGVSRGLGSAVGFTLLGAALIALLQQAVQQNIPLIGDFLAKVVQVVQEHMRR